MLHSSCTLTGVVGSLDSGLLLAARLRSVQTVGRRRCGRPRRAERSTAVWPTVPALAPRAPQAKTPAPGKLKEYKEYVERGEGSQRPDVAALRAEVEELAHAFPMPGL